MGTVPIDCGDPDNADSGLLEHFFWSGSIFDMTRKVDFVYGDHIEKNIYLPINSTSRNSENVLSTFLQFCTTPQTLQIGHSMFGNKYQQQMQMSKSKPQTNIY